LHASGGGVDLACRALGLRYEVQEDAPPLFPSLFGRLYYNVAEAHRRLPRLTWFDRRRIRGRAAALEQRMRREVLPRLLARHISTATSTFDGLSTGRLVREIRTIFDHFVTEIAAEIETATMVAEVLVDDARRALMASGHDPVEWLGQIGEAHDDRAETLRSAFARRALLDYALATPRSSDGARPFADVPYAFRRDSARRSAANREDGVLSRRNARKVAAARSARRLSEDVRRAAMREVDLLRKALLAVDRRFDLGNGIFLLSLEEIMALSNADRERASRLVTVRQSQRASIALAATLPERLSLSVLEAALWLEGSLNETGGGRTEKPCFGVRVSGARRVGGRTCVVDEAAASAGEPLTRLMPGDVLVAPFIHEAWLDDIVRASGVILSGGGWLCEAAILARERNIAMTVDVARWGDIPDGGYVTLELDGSIRIDAPPAPVTRGIPFAVASST
jgi:phosphohistidine swiveling domain-containing protein